MNLDEDRTSKSNPMSPTSTSTSNLNPNQSPNKPFLGVSLNQPISEENAIGCIIKLYKEDHTIKLNEEIEFYGILSYQSNSDFEMYFYSSFFLFFL